MALAEVQHIIEILKNADQKKLAQNQQRMEQERQDSEAANRLAMRDQADKELQERIREHDITAKAAQAMMDLQKAHFQLTGQQALQQIGESAQKTGVMPTGAQVSPAASSTGSEPNFTPANPQQATNFNLSIPGVNGSVNVASPEAAAKRQAVIEETLAAPKRETERQKQQAETDRFLQTQKAQQEAETTRQLKVNQQNQTAEMEREKLRIAAENHRNTVTTATQLKIAQLPYQIFNNMDPQTRSAVTQPSIDGLLNGTMSASQVQKEFASKGMAGAGTAVIATFMGSGGVPPTDKQVTFIQSVKPIVDSIPLIDEYIKMLPETKNSVSSLLTGATHPDVLNRDLDAKMKQIKFNIATVAKNLSGDQGQRLQKALLEPAEGGYLPSKWTTTKANLSNLNKLKDVINSAVDSQLGSLPVAQRNHIKQQMGLNGGGVAAAPVVNSDTHIHFDAQGNIIKQ